MKKLIILLFIILCMSLQGYAQCNLPYKPLTSYGKDTTAFMMYNFRDRGACYKGKTLKEVLADLKIPIKDYRVSGSMKNAQATIGIYIYIYSRIGARTRKEKNIEPNFIEIVWEKEYKWDDDLKIHKKYSSWNADVFNYFKDRKIQSIETFVAPNSKYYSKYYKKPGYQN